MPLQPLRPPPTPDDGGADVPPARRRSSLGRWVVWAALLTVSVIVVSAVGLMVLPHAAKVQRVSGALHWIQPVIGLVYLVALVLVWTRGVAFFDWLAKARGHSPLPSHVSRAARNCLAALVGLMALTVLLHWLSGNAR